MIDSAIMALILTIFVVLFVSVHAFLDIKKFRPNELKTKSNSEKSSNHFSIPQWAKITAFIPSIVFWLLFLASPLLFYTEVYKEYIPVLMRCPQENVVQDVGLLLLLMGIILADWGRISRGVIAPSLEMPEGYALCTHGAYRVVRHPMYVSYSLFFVGLPFVFLNPFLALCIVGIPGYYRIAQEEERVLTNRFGGQYSAYQKEVGMFWPKF